MVTVFLRDAMTVEEFLAAGCIKKGLSPVEHFIRVKKRRDMPTMNYFVPHRSDLIETYLSTHEVVEVCGKILYQVKYFSVLQIFFWLYERVKIILEL